MPTFAHYFPAFSTAAVEGAAMMEGAAASSRASSNLGMRNSNVMRFALGSSALLWPTLFTTFLLNAKGKLPREPLWIAKVKIGGEWTDEIT